MLTAGGAASILVSKPKVGAAQNPSASDMPTHRQLDNLTYKGALELLAQKARVELIRRGLPVEGRTDAELVRSYDLVRRGSHKKKPDHGDS